MSEYIRHTPNHNTAGLAPAGDANAKRPRGRIPRGAWGYVLGLYDQANETLKMIGDRFGVEPSAVHYVLRQAREKGLEPTLTAPSSDLMATPRRLIDGRQMPREKKAQQASAPASVTASAIRIVEPQPTVDLAMAEASRSPLAKRVMDSSAEIINAILHFEKDPTRENSHKLDEARKTGLRAMAAIEIWLHQMNATLQVKQPKMEPVQNNEQNERLQEIA